MVRAAVEGLFQANQPLAVIPTGMGPPDGVCDQDTPTPDDEAGVLAPVRGPLVEDDAEPPRFPFIRRSGEAPLEFAAQAPFELLHLGPGRAPSLPPQARIVEPLRPSGYERDFRAPDEAVLRPEEQDRQLDGERVREGFPRPNRARGRRERTHDPRGWHRLMVPQRQRQRIGSHQKNRPEDQAHRRSETAADERHGGDYQELPAPPTPQGRPWAHRSDFAAGGFHVS